MIGKEEQMKQSNKTDVKKLKIQLNSFQQKIKATQSQDILSSIIKIHRIKQKSSKMIEKLGINELKVYLHPNFYKSIKKSIVISQKQSKKNKFDLSESENSSDEKFVDQQDKDKQGINQSSSENQSQDEKNNKESNRKESNFKPQIISQKRYKKKMVIDSDSDQEDQKNNDADQNRLPQPDFILNQATKIYKPNADSSAIEVYVFGTKIYKIITYTNYQLYRKLASTQFKNELFITGGMIQNKADDRSFIFNGKSLSKFQSMMEKRFSHSLVATQKQLFALGGHDGQTIIDKTQVYSRQLKIWNPLPPLILARSSFAACSAQIYIYVFCGMTNGVTLFTNSIERLEVKNKSNWKEVAFKPSQEWQNRAWIGAFTINKDEILIYGHQNKNHRNFKYNVSQNQIEQFKTKVIPQTSGYWCPAIINQRNKDELYVANYASDNFLVYNFKSSQKNWEEIKLKKSQ